MADYVQSRNQGGAYCMFFGKNFADLYFKDTPEGRVFFGYGAASRGYLVDEAAEARIRAFLGTWTTLASAFLIAAIAADAVFGAVRLIVVELVPLALFVLAYVVAMRRILAGYPRVATRIGFGEIFAAQARAMSNARLVMLLVFGFLLTTSSLYILVASWSKMDKNTLLGAACLLLFGALFVGAIVQARVKWGAK